MWPSIGRAWVLWGACAGLSALAACAAQQPVAAPKQVAAAQVDAPVCKIEGCCAGHGDVAFLQRDLAIICKDGTQSLTCDCHR